MKKAKKNIMTKVFKPLKRSLNVSILILAITMLVSPAQALSVDQAGSIYALELCGITSNKDISPQEARRYYADCSAKKIKEFSNDGNRPSEIVQTSGGMHAAAFMGRTNWTEVRKEIFKDCLLATTPDARYSEASVFRIWDYCRAKSGIK